MRVLEAQGNSLAMQVAKLEGRVADLAALYNTTVCCCFCCCCCCCCCWWVWCCSGGWWTPARCCCCADCCCSRARPAGAPAAATCMRLHADEHGKQRDGRMARGPHQGRGCNRLTRTSKPPWRDIRSSVGALHLPGPGGPWSCMHCMHALAARIPTRAFLRRCYWRMLGERVYESRGCRGSRPLHCLQQSQA